MSPQERERLEMVCQQEGLKIHERELPGGMLALYVRREPTDTIYLSPAIHHVRDWLARTVVYHEIGHSKTFLPYLPLHTLEARADRWAAEHLIDPSAFFIAAVTSGGNPDQMAEILNVSPELVCAYRPK